MRQKFFTRERLYMAQRASKESLNAFEPRSLLASIDGGKMAMLFSIGQCILSPEDAGDAVFYILEGQVRMSVVSGIAREVGGVLSAGEFFGESCLAGKRLRIASVTAMTDCAVLRIERKQMPEALRREPALLEMFVGYLLRTIPSGGGRGPALGEEQRQKAGAGCAAVGLFGAVWRSGRRHSRGQRGGAG